MSSIGATAAGGAQRDVALMRAELAGMLGPRAAGDIAADVEAQVCACACVCAWAAAVRGRAWGS